jgi:hypothetical protein
VPPTTRNRFFMSTAVTGRQKETCEDRDAVEANGRDCDEWELIKGRELWRREPEKSKQQ